MSPSDEIQAIFLRCIDEFGPGHVRFLNYLSNDKRRTETYTRYCHTWGHFVSLGMSRAAHRHFSGMFPLMLNDLWTRGFAYVRTLETEFRGEQIITQEGAAFLEFIKKYEPKARPMTQEVDVAVDRRSNRVPAG